MLFRLFCCLPTQLKKDSPSHSGDARPIEAAPRSSDIHGGHDSYLPTCPLPRYTERPISIYEKTIVFNRGPDTQNVDGNRFPRDEKTQQNSNGDGTLTQPVQCEPETLVHNTGGDHTSDASSTFSIPSSYGNTSTATRSPPPAYSPPNSRAASQRTPSISLPPVETDPNPLTLRTGISPSPQALLQHPRPVQHRDGRSNPWIIHDTGRRRSWESNQSISPVPPTYTRD